MQENPAYLPVEFEDFHVMNLTIINPEPQRSTYHVESLDAGGPGIYHQHTVS